jgi:hypothetical protein
MDVSISLSGKYIENIGYLSIPQARTKFPIRKEHFFFETKNRLDKIYYSPV